MTGEAPDQTDLQGKKRNHYTQGKSRNHYTTCFYNNMSYAVPYILILETLQQIML